MTKNRWVIKIRTCSDRRLRSSSVKTANLRNWLTISKKCSRIQMIKAIQRRRRRRRRRKNQRRRRRRRKKRRRRIKTIKRRRNRMLRTKLRVGYAIATKRIRRKSTMPRNSSRRSSPKMTK